MSCVKANLLKQIIYFSLLIFHRFFIGRESGLTLHDQFLSSAKCWDNSGITKLSKVLDSTQYSTTLQAQRPFGLRTTKYEINILYVSQLKICQQWYCLIDFVLRNYA